MVWDQYLITFPGLSHHAVCAHSPIPTVPRADPLGRNLSKDKAAQELPPGMVLEDSGGQGAACSLHAVVGFMGFAAWVGESQLSRLGSWGCWMVL
jgi:hypothetical protein